uniref:Uncharacterized protein n=1 Tax=Anguilla anguilla TaxID=7936 RepID=A0A0E9U856_ANGAN
MLQRRFENVLHSLHRHSVVRHERTQSLHGIIKGSPGIRLASAKKKKTSIIIIR